MLRNLIQPRSQILIGTLLADNPWPSDLNGSLSTLLYDTPGKLLIAHFVAGMVWALLPPNRLLKSRTVAGVAAVALVAGYAGGFSPFVTPWALTIVLFWLSENLPFTDMEKRLGGDYSYGPYLSGYPIQQTLAHFGVRKHGVLIYGVTAYFLALMLAVASWRLIERPALGLKDRFGGRGAIR